MGKEWAFAATRHFHFKLDTRLDCDRTSQIWMFSKPNETHLKHKLTLPIELKFFPKIFFATNSPSQKVLRKND